MKRYFFIILLLMGVSTAVSYGQTTTHYRATKDNVNVRTGPGTNYDIEDDGFGEELQLYKGQIVTGEKKENGFINVSFLGHYMYEGWVSAKFLIPAKVCAKCKGKRGFGKCPVCNGAGARVCCNYTGKKICTACGGEGYK